MEMRFDEPDVREAYRRGVRDCFESVADGLTKRQARQVEAWLKELDAWDYSDPPPAPLG
jgi:hypothetical protein